MDYDFKWIRPNMSLYHIDKNSPFPITLLNSGNLADDFNKYAEDFFNAAESVIHYLGEDAAENGDIEKLDLWYFAMVYLYRQSMELLLVGDVSLHQNIAKLLGALRANISLYNSALEQGTGSDVLEEALNKIYNLIDPINTERFENYTNAQTSLRNFEIRTAERIINKK